MTAPAAPLSLCPLRAAAAPGQAARSLAQAWARAADRRTLFATPDRDCARQLVGRVFKPHRLEPRRGAAPMAAHMEHLPVGLLGVSRLRYGAAVDIVPGPLESFYLIQVPIAGQARIRQGNEECLADPGCATLLSPQPDLRMHWSADNDQLIVRINAACVQRFLSCWSGQHQRQAPQFAARLPLDGLPRLTEVLHAIFGYAQALHEVAALTGDASAGDDPTRRYPLSAAQLQYRLLACLFESVPSSAAAVLTRGCPPLAPRSVRQVEDYLLAHCERPLTPEHLARLVGVSVRSLFLGFQRYRGVSPMQLLRELRLHRAHDELLRAGAGTQVTEVALRWGFAHMGRFGQVYRQAFGELPRDTLLAARGF